MDATATEGSAGRHRADRAADLVRWGPVVAGAVVGLGAFALFGALWFATAAGSPDGLVADNLGWFVGVTGIGALLLAGFAAGLLAGVRGGGAGLANGVTAWSLLVVLFLVGGVPGALGVSGALDLGLTAEQALWTLFWSLLVGLGCAAAGGLLGGLVDRPVVAAGSRGGPGATDGPEARDAPAPEKWTTGDRVVDERPTGAAGRG